MAAVISKYSGIQEQTQNQNPVTHSYLIHVSKSKDMVTHMEQ